MNTKNVYDNKRVEVIPHPEDKVLFQRLLEEQAILIDRQGWCEGDLYFMAEMNNLSKEQTAHFYKALVGETMFKGNRTRIDFDVKIVYINGHLVAGKVIDQALTRYPDAKIKVMSN